MQSDGPILFTAFEPSGDALAAPLVAELRRRQPRRPIFAMGGAAMAEAGTELIEATTEHAVMLAGAVGQALAHRQRLRRLRTWLAEHPIAALVPTDSPAANWSICKAVRDVRPEAKIIHLVAPQLWAWAPWRICKLRRLTDRVMCMLPFEPDWFEPRGVPATFVGHPLFTDPAEPKPLAAQGAPRLALLPGSRASEVKKNWPIMLAALDELQSRHPGLTATVAASSEAQAGRIRALCPAGELPAGVEMVLADASAVLDRADLALVVSGTATLHALSRHTPMVVLYRASRPAWHLLGRWLVRTRTFALPNLLGEWAGLGRVVPEHVPHFGGLEPVLRDLAPLAADPAARTAQRERLDTLATHFQGIRYHEAAADVIERELS
ncbi:MAG: lipid-A-disaccharide synthase [Phycisphaeraceae bacterium]